MKTFLLFLTILISTGILHAQITTPIIKANFGVDGELRANYFYNFQQSGNDDWFRLPATPGSGDFVIDTTGAAAILAGYNANPALRQIPFYRKMRYPAYSLMNNKRVVDAVFIRDYHGDDSTVFASGANKNGMSPAMWSCPMSQSVPDKNEILDMFVHVRREGPIAADSLWMFGGLSIENTTGNRYFDFEMYQTDIYYDRPSQRFYGYGPDAGHTRWQFDAAGNITVPGDIIFTAEYSTSALNTVEARIWVDKSALLIDPQGFDWTGSFDGANNGSQYGYAGIQPETAGAFYTGLTNPSAAWAGPFALVRTDNSVVTNYTTNQFMEFSINLTKIGLDPVTLLGGNSCGMPFRRILVKSRSSTSFTAELKDFVGPFDFFLAPRADISANIPFFCGSSFGVSDITVNNAIATSVYTWSTPNGTIANTSADGTRITVTSAGTYIVTQRLQAGCSVYATDTVTIGFDAFCTLLPKNLLGFDGQLSGEQVNLQWRLATNHDARQFTLERSTDGIHYTAIASSTPNSTDKILDYAQQDNISNVLANNIYYRLLVTDINGAKKYSEVVTITPPVHKLIAVAMYPNPVHDKLQLQVFSPTGKTLQLDIYDLAGKKIKTFTRQVAKGNSVLVMDGFSNWATGVYPVKITAGNECLAERLVITR
ncbi:MAG TPA: T9SS type A sorting domain-containing protein [Chitinophagaceae bacterium]|nr:T9SS type A sorting domain-containing protein [Chitinophagaceae bacterium]